MTAPVNEICVKRKWRHLALIMAFICFASIFVSKLSLGASKKFVNINEDIRSDLMTVFNKSIDFKENTFQYQNHFEEASKKYGLPLALVLAVARGESFFNPNAVSSMGAIGLMQVMPGTGKIYGYSSLDLKDPQKNIDAGVHYLADMYAKFQDPYHTLAAYYGGPGKVNTQTGQVRDDCDEYVKYVHTHFKKVMQTSITGEQEYASKLSNFVLAVFDHVADDKPFTKIIRRKVPGIKMDIFREEAKNDKGILVFKYKVLVSYSDESEKASLCKKIEKETGFRLCK